MKNFLLICTAFSALSSGQQKKHLDWSVKDSVAVDNVNTILNFSKKSFFNSGAKSHVKSDINNNVALLWENQNNFNTINGGRYRNYTAPWALLEPLTNPARAQGRTVTTFPVYNSNKK